MVETKTPWHFSSGAVGGQRPIRDGSGGEWRPLFPLEGAVRKIAEIVPWLLALYIAYIFVFYLQYKFTGHPGSTELFTTLTDWLGFHGHEKFMRIGTGSFELLASILVLIPATQVVGAALALCLMTGAIFFHLVSPLGIDPYGDGGVLFKQACSVWLSSIVILTIRRQRAIALIDHYLPFLPIPARLRAF
jgi:uncharacterized membrane protein YphA (DoxX/SURF4 family)